jgi:hypothetical protein
MATYDQIISCSNGVPPCNREILARACSMLRCAPPPLTSMHSMVSTPWYVNLLPSHTVSGLGCLAGKTPCKRVFRSCSSGWVPPPEVRVLGFAACRNWLCKPVLRHYHRTTLMAGGLRWGCRPCAAETKPNFTPGFGRKSSLDTHPRSVLPPPCAKNPASRPWSAALDKREMDCVPSRVGVWDSAPADAQPAKSTIASRTPCFTSFPLSSPPDLLPELLEVFELIRG